MVCLNELTHLGITWTISYKPSWFSCYRGAFFITLVFLWESVGANILLVGVYYRIFDCIKMSFFLKLGSPLSSFFIQIYALGCMIILVDCTFYSDFLILFFYSFIFKSRMSTCCWTSLSAGTELVRWKVGRFRVELTVFWRKGLSVKSLRKMLWW